MEPRHRVAAASVPGGDDGGPRRATTGRRRRRSVHGVADHVLAPTPSTVSTVFSSSAPAVLRVDSGDRVEVRALDVLGHLEPFTGSDEGVPTLLPQTPGPSAIGPIAVRGARPGSVLAVRVVSVEPGEHGWTMSGWQGSRLEADLGLGADGTEGTTWVHWDVDRVGGTATTDGLTIDVHPFLGVVGLVPGGEDVPMVRPHACGGNLDCSALVAGSTLYLPVAVPDAMLYVGDGHVAQGDGEVSGTAVECAVRCVLEVSVVQDAPLTTTHAVTPSGRVTFGLSTDLDEAMTLALDDMVTWVQALHGGSRARALALASAAVDLRITQVASPVWGVHAVLPLGALRRG